jgi:hypothetical protein
MSALKLGPDAITRRPAFDLLLLADSAMAESFHSSIEWAVAEINAHEQRTFIVDGT